MYKWKYNHRATGDAYVDIIVPDVDEYGLPVAPKKTNDTAATLAVTSYFQVLFVLHDMET